MAQGESPRNPLAFASVFYPGRCLASQPTGSGGERAVESQKHGPVAEGVGGGGAGEAGALFWIEQHKRNLKKLMKARRRGGV